MITKLMLRAKREIGKMNTDISNVHHNSNPSSSFIQDFTFNSILPGSNKSKNIFKDKILTTFTIVILCNTEICVLNLNYFQKVYLTKLQKL
jgi:hypothetical protein